MYRLLLTMPYCHSEATIHVVVDHLFMIQKQRTRWAPEILGQEPFTVKPFLTGRRSMIQEKMDLEESVIAYYLRLTEEMTRL